MLTRKQFLLAGTAGLAGLPAAAQEAPPHDSLGVLLVPSDILPDGDAAKAARISCFWVKPPRCPIHVLLKNVSPQPIRVCGCASVDVDLRLEVTEVEDRKLTKPAVVRTVSHRTGFVRAPAAPPIREAAVAERPPLAAPAEACAAAFEPRYSILQPGEAVVRDIELVDVPDMPGLEPTSDFPWAPSDPGHYTMRVVYEAKTDTWKKENKVWVGTIASQPLRCIVGKQ